MRPLSTPKASSSTFTIGTKQFVVHEALDTTLWVAGSNVSSLTPTTKVASAPFDGAETITNGAPASRCMAALSRSVKKPVDSITTSTPRSPQGSCFGSRTCSTLSVSPSTMMPSSTTWTSDGKVPWTESYFSRWAMVSSEPRSLTATKSRSAPIRLAARKTLRPMRPNPLMPTRTVMSLPFVVVVARASSWARDERPFRG